jgi:type VI secretion system protein ImpH
VGDEIWDQQSRVRIQLGPLRLEQYMDFLPGRDGYKQVRALAGFYAGEECDVEIQLILRKDDVPACELTEGGAQLGWTSWAKTGVLARDPDETVLEL